MANGDSGRPKSMNSRPNSRHQKSHKLERGQTAPVDKVLFLKARATGRNLEVATLVTSEGGYIRFWCLYGARHEMGYFYAPDQTDESVLGMCTNNNNSLLVTGDTQGNIRVWDIMEFCIRFQEKGRIKTKPPLEAYWKAHDSAIVSVEYAKHDTGEYIITASTDKTARLWTLREGQYIGTFGQKRSWNLKEPTTWAHPATPWTVAESNKKETDSNTTASDQKSQVTDGDLEPELVKITGEETEDNPPIEVTTEKKDKSHDPDTSANQGPLEETFLGVKVETELQRKQQARQDRREQFGGIMMKKTQQYGGKLCSPFQALSVPSVMDIKIPDNMPLSQRMINKGYTSANLTEDKLLKMDFGYGGPDSPPSGEQGETASRKNISGTRQSDRDDKTRSSFRATPNKQLYTPVFKKHHTVA